MDIHTLLKKPSKTWMTKLVVSQKLKWWNTWFTKILKGKMDYFSIDVFEGYFQKSHTFYNVNTEVCDIAIF